MSPEGMPVIARPPIVLRAFRDDVGLVKSAAGEPLIPLITTGPASGDAGDARAYIARQHERLASGTGYSFAIAAWRAAERVGYVREGLLRRWQRAGASGGTCT